VEPLPSDIQWPATVEPAAEAPPALSESKLLAEILGTPAEGAPMPTPEETPAPQPYDPSPHPAPQPYDPRPKSADPGYDPSPKPAEPKRGGFLRRKK
jgi:hypothetical protein